MSNHIANIHMVLTICGVIVKAARTLIINNKSLTSIADFGFLGGGDDDVTAMSSCMARRVANNGRVILGGIQIKKIQALVWWIRNRHNLVHPIDADLWTAAEMTNAGISKRIEKDHPKAHMKAADLKAFNPDEFETHEDAFQNFLSQRKSVTRKFSLLYIFCPSVSPVIFTDGFEERMFQMPLTGQECNLDNRTLFAKLKDFLIGVALYALIE